jgi:FRG domain
MGLPTSHTKTQYEKLVGDAVRIQSLAEFDREIENIAQASRATTGGQPKLWFRGHADSKWFLSPPTLRDPEFQKQYEYERHSFIDFKRRTIGLLHAEPKTQWGWLYLAQHHGLPTRLLDWTEGSHIALFFAIGSRKDADANEACVWVLNPGALNERLWKFSNVVTVDDEVAGSQALLYP